MYVNVIVAHEAEITAADSEFTVCVCDVHAVGGRRNSVIVVLGVKSDHTAEQLKVLRAIFNQPAHACNRIKLNA